MTEFTEMPELILKPVAEDTLDSLILQRINGRDDTIEEETGFIFQRFSGFASKKVPKPNKNKNAPIQLVDNPSDKRNFIKIKLDPENNNCNYVRDTMNKYDNFYQ
jgi:hypothetical protein